MRQKFNAVTLLELIITIVLLSIVVLSLGHLDIFSHYQVLSAERRAKMQQEASFALDHMANEISKAIGDASQFPVAVTTIQGDPAIRVWVDYNKNGRRDDYPDDCEIAYRFTGAQGNPSDRYQIWYYANCIGPNCNQPGSIGPEVISHRISDLSFNVQENTVTPTLTACWDPTGLPSTNNPCVNMTAAIKMPSVSTH